MNWFKRDTKLYIGPVSDSQIDDLLSNPRLVGCGISCIAGGGKVETYLTVKDSGVDAKVLNDIRREVLSQ